jgi:hypothetical protein
VGEGLFLKAFLSKEVVEVVVEVLLVEAASLLV